MFPSILLYLSAVAAVTFAQTAATGPLEVHNITRVANSRFENLAIRSNGQILGTTTAPLAQVFQIDPLGIRPPVVVTTFPNLTSALGIHELKPDIFYVATSNFSIVTPTTFFPSTLHVFQVDLRQFNVTPNGTIVKPPAVQQVASLPNGTLLNGMTSVPGAKDFVLVSDTFAGVIWHVDVNNGAVSAAYKDATLLGPGPGSAKTGANGIYAQGGQLYYCNTGGATLYKVALGSNGYVSSKAKPSAIVGGIPCDDFTVDAGGNLYVASTLGALFKVTPGGVKTLLAGTPNSTVDSLYGSTSAKFGRLDSDRDSLYISTDGGVATTINGTMGISRVDFV